MAQTFAAGLAAVRPGQTTLDLIALHQPMRVAAVQAPAGAPEWAARLEEIGFWPGEQVSVLAQGLPGQDPLVVRVGDSTFALRRDEAACIAVEDLAVEDVAVSDISTQGAGHA